VVCACRRLAYDGRGNAVVRSAGELDAAVDALGGYEHGLYAERWCPYQKVQPGCIGSSTLGTKQRHWVGSPGMFVATSHIVALIIVSQHQVVGQIAHPGLSVGIVRRRAPLAQCLVLLSVSSVH
jgi:hypothetical protein